jgi:hypothetical protein
MPPSGFSQEAINGLLEFVGSNYRSILSQYKVDIENSEEKFLIKSSIDLRRKVEKSIKDSPLDVDSTGILGLVTFMTLCYEDLVKEIQAGKDKYDRPVIDGRAMQKEISQIKDYLGDFKL